MKLSNESKTMFIPLLGKAKCSKDKIFIHDPKAEEIITKLEYDLRSIKYSNWLSLYMSLRSLIIDELCNNYMLNRSDVTVIHLGCGLDSRCLRVKKNFINWYDIDFENVINIRESFYTNDFKYKMLGFSVTDYKWLEQIDKSRNILIIMEGLIMYLSEDEIKELIQQISKRFDNVHLLFDSYSKKGVKYSKIKNPVNQVGAKIKYGFDKPSEFLLLNDKLEYLETHFIKKNNNGLFGLKKFIFNNLFCGKFSQSIYKIYEFKLNKK